MDRRREPKYRKVYAFAPSGMVTGGPELCHQLVHEIRSLGGDAAVHYTPDPSTEVPAPYRAYDVEVSRASEWGAGDAVIYPETMLRRMPLRSRATPFIWWQSYDNAVNTVSSRPRQLISRAFKRTLCNVQRISRCRHVFQSHYAKDKLASWGFPGDMLSDYITTEPATFTNDFRQNIICFNPKKGAAITRSLIAANPDLKFAPIANMNKDQVLRLLESSMLYVDFGEHPGKDRLPREAAMRGAVVLVGRRGSAGNSLDVPLDAQYKLEFGSDFITRASRQIRRILTEFPLHQQLQACFRTSLRGEHSTFRGQVQSLFFH